MKKNIHLAMLCFAVLLSIATQAQVPALTNYQAVVRNAAGQPVINQAVNARFVIHDGSAAGTEVYVETQTFTTNGFGLITHQIGNGTVETGSFASVEWYDGSKWLEVLIDPAGGTSYTSYGSDQLTSVPYAQYARGLQSSNDGGMGIQGTSASSLWLGLFEGGTYRGYLGSYSGDNDDVDFGTGDSNDTGSVHLVIKAQPKFTINPDGWAGVLTTNPGSHLNVSGATGTFDEGFGITNATANSTWHLYSSSSGNMIIGRTGNLGQFDGTTGAYATISDARLKTNIRPLESVLAKIMDLDVKRYEYKNNNPAHKQSIGVIAQELQAKFPEYVTVNTTNEGNPEVQNQLAVDYAGLSVLAIKAIQEQQQTIEAVKAENKQLKDAYADLLKRLENLEKAK